MSCLYKTPDSLHPAPGLTGFERPSPTSSSSAARARSAWRNGLAKVASPWLASFLAEPVTISTSLSPTDPGIPLADYRQHRIRVALTCLDGMQWRTFDLATAIRGGAVAISSRGHPRCA
jgi:hypothetical protein